MKTDALTLILEELALESNKESVTQTIFITESRKPKDGVLENVHILGFDSKNGYTYEAEAVSKAISLYEGAEVYLNHSEVTEDGKPLDRDIKDKFGYFKNVKFAAESGVRGDFVYNTKHPYAPAFEWWVENAPGKLGFSHEAGVRKTPQGRVTEIGAVRLVALVSTPATTAGVFEGVIQDKIDADAKANRLRNVWYTASSLICDAMYMAGEDVEDDGDRAQLMLPILRDLTKELRTLANSPEEASEGNIMDLTKLTLDEIKKAKPELIAEAIRERDAAEKEIATKVSEAVKEVPEKLRSEIFLALVRESINDPTKLKALIEDRKAIPIAEKKPETTPAVTPVQESLQKKEEAPKALTDADVLTAWGK